MDPSLSHPAVQTPIQTSNPKHRWISWAITIGILVAAIIHATVRGIQIKDEKKRKQVLLRIFVGYLIGGLCGWLAIVYLFLPHTFAPDVLKGSGPARRISGFSCLAFSVGGIISAIMKSVPEQRVAVATFTVFMLGVAGVQLYTLKGKSTQKVKIYSIPVVKLLSTLILIVFASIADGKESKE